MGIWRVMVRVERPLARAEDHWGRGKATMGSDARIEGKAGSGAWTEEKGGAGAEATARPGMGAEAIVWSGAGAGATVWSGPGAGVEEPRTGGKARIFWSLAGV